MGSTMVIIDFANTKKQAFISGFAKGLAAPFMLFGSFKAPALTPVADVDLSTHIAQNPIENDWRAIGKDFSRILI
jgi:hypothetical protein